MQTIIHHDLDLYLEATALLCRKLHVAQEGLEGIDPFESADTSAKELFCHIPSAGADMIGQMQKKLDTLKKISDDVFSRMTAPQEKLDFYFKRSLSISSYSLGIMLWLLTTLEKNPLDLPPEHRHSLLVHSLMIAINNEFDENNIPKDEDELIAFLEDSGCKPEDCWKLLSLYRNMEKYYTEIKPIWDEAVALLQPWIPELLDLTRPIIETFETNLSQNPDWLTHRYPLQFDKEKLDIYFSPLLSFTLSCQMLTGSYHSARLLVGIFVDDFVQAREESSLTGRNLLRGLKCLSDNTRLEILYLLKNSSMCGQELVQHLSLSPATISHHMNAFCNSNFIIISPDGNRVNYQLNREVLASFIDTLQKYLL